jgi:hypothetical protein
MFLSLWKFFSAATILLPLHLIAADSAPWTASLLDHDLLCLHVHHLAGDFARDFFAVQTTNTPAGVILDLRSADGDQAAAASARGFFAARKIPLVILVNGQTHGAAAALAVNLRAAGEGILVGPGDFPGTVRPDIAVTVAGEDEKQYLADPYFNPALKKSVASSATNELSAFVDHTSEADLVRQRVKDGDEADDATPRVESSQPVIRDPALARAVDLFKALAALHPARG